MKKIWILGGVLFLLLSVALIAGCTGEERRTELRIGYQPSTHQMAHITAMEKGWWQEDLAPYGIVTVTDYVFPSGPPEMQAMIAGELDIAYTGSAPLLSALTTGLDAKIVAAVQTQGSDLVLRNDIPYSGPQDLKGLRIATFPPGSIQDTLLRDWLLKNGLDPETDVTILAMGPGDAVTAINAGQVDGVFLPHPAPTTIAMAGKGRTVVQSGEINPNHACCVLAVRGDLIRENPEIVEQIVRTHIKATEYNKNHLEEAAMLYANKTGAKFEEINLSLLEWDGTWIADPNVIVDSVVDYARIQYELGFIKQPLTKEEIFDLTFYDRVTR